MIHASGRVLKNITVVILGDLNMNRCRLEANSGEGKY